MKLIQKRVNFKKMSECDRLAHLEATEKPLKSESDVINLFSNFMVKECLEFRFLPTVSFLQELVKKESVEINLLVAI